MERTPLAARRHSEYALLKSFGGEDLHRPGYPIPYNAAADPGKREAVGM